MPASTASQFGKLVPGFDFLQGLASNASSALPGIGQWIAPTLNPEELDKRIAELRTVQFWLEQNARLLGATVQALEVQRMTLATLRSMNVPMTPLHESLRAQAPEAPAPAPRRKPPGKAADAEPAGAEAVAVDPMQWWGALTQQFTELATSAMKEALSDRTPPAGTAAPARPARAAAGPPAGTPPDRPAAATAGAAAPRSSTAETLPRTRPAEAGTRRRERGASPVHAPDASNTR
jgi:hypothetical protein